jgi:hypothetical protein
LQIVPFIPVCRLIGLPLQRENASRKPRSAARIRAVQTGGNPNARIPVLILLYKPYATEYDIVMLR